MIKLIKSIINIFSSKGEEGIKIIDNLTGVQFEEFLSINFKKLGYKVALTSVINDYGADLILRKKHKKIVVQAKRNSGKVGIAAIQEIIGAKAYYKADKCMVVTNSYFTKNAVELARSNNVELWDRTRLIIEFNITKDMLSETFGKCITNKRICKRCGADMKLKGGKYGKFYGCSNYPKCNYTEKFQN